MAIQRTHKQSDLEKRLKVLNQQLYGKRTEEKSKSKQIDSSSINTGYKLPLADVKFSGATSSKSLNDVNYLKADLLKITILTVAAFAVQFLLYYLIQINVISLSFINF